MKQDHFASDDRIVLGEGLFETIKVKHFKPCFPELHWQRMSRSAQNLGIPFALSATKWHELLLEHIQQEHLEHGGIKVILSGGRAPRGLITQGTESNLLLHCFTYSTQSKPLHLVQASWLRDARNPVYQLKTVNYLEAIMARRAAAEQGADEVLFFNTQGHLMEAACANVFLVYEGRLLTPPQSDGVLPGITRLRLLKLSVDLNRPCEEVSITKEMVKASEAMVLTNALQGIQYVASLEEHIYSTTHPLVERLLALI